MEDSYCLTSCVDVRVSLECQRVCHICVYVSALPCACSVCAFIFHRAMGVIFDKKRGKETMTRFVVRLFQNCSSRDL